MSFVFATAFVRDSPLIILRTEAAPMG